MPCSYFDLISNEIQEPTYITLELMKIKDANKITLHQRSYEFNKDDFILVEVIDRSRNAVERYRHILSGEYVVIKFTKISCSATLEKFKEATEIHKTLQNSSASVDYYGFAIFADHVLIFMESMEMSLSHLYKMMHKTINYFPELLWAYIAVKLIVSLVDLRQKGIFHRDIKPDNILISKEGEIKLCDFEFSKIIEGSVASTFVGTIYYWPPERFNNNIENYDDRADVWSLGITLAEIAYGKMTLGKNSHSNDEYIHLRKEIIDFCKEGFIKKCFKGYSDKIIALIHKCLLPYEERPKMLELKKSDFFVSYYWIEYFGSFIKESYLKHIKIKEQKLENEESFFDFFTQSSILLNIKELFTSVLDSNNVVIQLSVSNIHTNLLLSSRKHMITEHMICMTINSNNVCDMLSIAAFYNLVNLKNACMNFIELNANFIKSENFLKVTYNDLLEMISYAMFAADEIDIFEATSKWVKENNPGDNKKHALFKQIRLTLIEQNDLISVIKPSGFFTSDEILETIKEQVNHPPGIKCRATLYCFNNNFPQEIVPQENVATIDKGVKVIQCGGPKDPTQVLFNGKLKENEFVFHKIQDEPIIIKLFRPYMIDSMKLKLYGYVDQSYYIEVSIDGSMYNKICEHKEKDDWQLIIFKRQIVQYIRIVGTYSGCDYFAITHFECPAQLRMINEVSI